MIQRDRSDDYVIATGETRSGREFVEAALIRAGLEPDIDKYVSYDKDMSRPSEVDLLVGNASKAHENLGRSPIRTFKELVGLMIENDLELESQSLRKSIMGFDPSGYYVAFNKSHHKTGSEKLVSKNFKKYRIEYFNRN